MSKQPEALRLAGALSSFAKETGLQSDGVTLRTAAELRRLHASEARLLEALEQCCYAIEQYGRSEGEPTQYDEAMFDSERAARAAIAAARGES